MTQRFGGLFSMLNQRDYADLVRLADNTPTDYNLESMSKQQLLNAIRDIKDFYEDVFQEYQLTSDYSRESTVKSMDSEEIQYITDIRSSITTLNRIKKKLESRK